MARAKRASFVLIILLAVGAAAVPTYSRATPATPSPGADERANALLRQAMSAERDTSFVAQVESIQFGPTGSVATIAREEHLAPDETHKLFLAPENVYGDSVVVRGTAVFSYDTKHQKVVISTISGADAQTIANGNLGLLLANYRPVINAPQIIAGRPTIACSLVNRYTSVRVLTLWIDADTHLILQKEAYHANGTIASRVQFDSIKYTRAMPAEIFATPVPAGYQVVRGGSSGPTSSDVERVIKEAGFTPAGPRYLPEGFTIVSADVTTVKNVKTLHLMYSDGVRSLSLFENAQSAAADFGGLKPSSTSVERHHAWYVNDGPTTLLSWKDKGLSFALVGDLDLKELRAIAASVS
jgi:negative regulator of sigma E activity